MLDFVIGNKSKAGIDSLIETLRRLDAGVNGIVYIGFPVVAIEGESITIDALFTSKKFGVVIFDVLDAPPRNDQWDEIEDRQNQLSAGLMSRLLLHRALRKGSALAFPIPIITYCSIPIAYPQRANISFATHNTLQEVLEGNAPLSDEIIVHLNAALQSVSTIKPRKKRAAVTKTTSRGAILKETEKNIANLDYSQRRAAIETPEGPQRIRGIAGSGKTIVLALKAAYLHAQHPDWTIGVTFVTRSLYQQFFELIRRFYFDQRRDDPDWSKLRVLHAWGSSAQPGVYSVMALAARVTPENFLSAKERHGDDSFQGICEELVRTIEEKPRPPIFDALLIDEAQDLPLAFFRLAYYSAKTPKRIVWAYDELQNLGAYSMAPPEELFGPDQDGRPLVTLRDIPGEPHQDVILPVCYRNTKWALATAHALGFGIYREEGLCQFFQDPGLWSDIGYEVEEGELVSGERVRLARRSDCSPKFFEKYLDPADSVQAHVFADEDKQTQWIVKSIKENLAKDELEPDDIMVIFPDPLTVRKKASPLIAALTKSRIPAHIVGVTSSRDEVFVPDSIAISGIRRAKGNEAPMVYVANSDYCWGGPALIMKRNILFTAITRSRAWVRACGCGDVMEKLGAEIKKAADAGYRLDFSVPTEQELERIRRIHRDMTIDEARVITETESALSEFLRRVDTGDLSLEHLGPEVRRRLRDLIDDDT